MPLGRSAADTLFPVRTYEFNAQVKYSSEWLGSQPVAGSRISRPGPPTSLGGANSQHSYLSKILYVNAKESGP